jgi:hypothetical protein
VLDGAGWVARLDLMYAHIEELSAAQRARLDEAH